MTENDFIAANQDRWRIFEDLVKEKPRRRFARPDVTVRFPGMYRALCRDLNFARARRYSVPLIDRLNAMVWKGHHILYQNRDRNGLTALGILIKDFPVAIRRFALPLLLCHVLFYGAALITYAYTVNDKDHAVAILGEEMSTQLLEIYDPGAEHFLRPRGVTSDADMFGFYISNNISIGFRTFASGGLAGIGSLFFVMFNAITLGAAAGLVVNAGFAGTFFPFVVGHSSFELTAILIFGLAGFLLGKAIIAPGRYSRADALKEAGKEVLPLVAGATLFLFFAACIEAFWSAGPIEPVGKFAVGAGLWVFVFSFFVWGGRHARRKN